MAAVCYGRNDLRLVPIAMPEPAFNEVVLEVDSCGICGTDVHFLKEGGFGEQKLIRPLVLGHESAGVVRKVGSAVTHLKVGERTSAASISNSRSRIGREWHSEKLKILPAWYTASKTFVW